MPRDAEATTLEPLLDDDKLAVILGIHPNTPANWRVRGQGPKHVRVGNRIRYDPRDVREWLETRKASSTSETVKAA